MGLTDAGYLSDGIKDFEKRLSRYTHFERIDLQGVKNGAQLDQDTLKKKEGELFLQKIEANDQLVLLDEIGKEFTSKAFAGFLQQRLNAGTRSLVFLIGGAFGFSQEIRQRADFTIALSQMTMTHQMVRLFFTEQLYRGFTIIHGEKYHH